MEVGKYTYDKKNIKLRFPGGNKLYVGNFCSIAGNCIVYLGGYHNSNWITTYPFGYKHKDIFDSFDGSGHPKKCGDVNIGNDVWIGDNVTIMANIKIGDGAIIATNSHVIKDVEPYAIYGGNPAKLIKYRFKKEQIEKLLSIKWWDWDEMKINENIHLLCNKDIDKFIKKHETENSDL